MTTTTTIADLTERTGVAVVADWPADCIIPVLTGGQRQGDVIILPADATATTWSPRPARRSCAASPAATRTRSTLTPDRVFCCDTLTADPASLVVARLLVPSGATAWAGAPRARLPRRRPRRLRGASSAGAGR